MRCATLEASDLAECRQFPIQQFWIGDIQFDQALQVGEAVEINFAPLQTDMAVIGIGGGGIHADAGTPGQTQFQTIIFSGFAIPARGAQAEHTFQ